jgi:Rgg/GadR/MutR family transcriptional activator
MEKESVNPIYGEVFAELRDQSTLSLGDFESVGVTKASLSRFENGSSLLRYDKLIAALQLLHVEEAEYSLIINDYHYDYFEVIMNRIITASDIDDKKTLEQWFKDSTKYEQRRIALASSCALHGGLAKEEIDELRDRFIAITTWTYFNLQVLSLTIDQLEEDLALSIMKDFWKPSFHYRNNYRYRKIVSRAGHRLAHTLIENGKKKKARELLSNLEAFYKEEDLVAKLCQKYEQGYFEYKFFSAENGLKQMKTVLELFKEQNCLKRYSYYERFYRKINKNLL